jgi:uncharacterized protein (TIRG00374 family)
VRRTLVGIAVSVIFLVLALRGQDFGAVWSTLTRAEYWYVIPAVALYFVGVWCRAARWSLLLQGLRPVRWVELFPLVIIGYMANNVLPLRAGEFVRAYALSTRAGVRKTAGLTTIALERLFDGLTMLGFMLVASLSVALTSPLRHLAVVTGILFVPLLVGLAIASDRRVRDALIRRAVPRLPRVARKRAERTVDSVTLGLSILQRRRDLAAVAAISLVAWLFEASTYLVVARAFDLQLGLMVVLLTTAVANLATLIPSSPGYVGPFEAGVLLVLAGVAGISREVALSYALVLHAMLYLPVTVWGLFFWWRESLSWRDVRRASIEEAAS